MSDRATRNGKALSLMIASMLAVGGILGILLAVTPGAQADSCGQASSLLQGNWVVNTAQTCTGIDFSLDGNLYIHSPGSLTIVNGGISFVEDQSHIHGLWVDAGATLTVDNSTITTALNLLSPYVKLAATVNGTLVLRNSAVLKFPGTLNLNSGSTLNMTASTITGFSDGQLSGLGNAAWIDDNDDSAVITMSTSTAYLYHSQIENIYENTQPGGQAKNLTLVSGSTMYAYDSYIGVDFSSNWQIHNVLTVDSTSAAYLYNVTVDEVQSSGTPLYQQPPAFVPSGAGAIYLLRWMDATATDPHGTPLASATLWSHIGTQTAQYPDNGNGLVPNSRTLWYLGRGTANWNKTDASGQATIPLWTDTITVASLPNAASFGTYQVTGTFNGTVANAAATFAPYPSITAADNNLPVTVAFDVPGMTPDLTVANVAISGANGVSDLQPLNTQITITATIRNTGVNAVSGVPVDFFSTNVDPNNDGIMDAPVSTYQLSGLLINSTTIATIGANGTATTSTTWSYQGSYETGLTLSVVVNPPVGGPSNPGVIPETNYTNNIATHLVTLFTWPDLAITGPSDIVFPTEPVANNDVPVDVMVHNLGTGGATSASLEIKQGSTLVSNVVTFSVETITTVVVLWHPTSVGPQNITFYVLTQNSTNPRTWDYNFANNWLSIQKSVLSQPDLALYSSDYTPRNATQNQAFSIVVYVHNLGETPVQNTSVAVYLNGNYNVVYGRTNNVSLIQNTNVTVQVRGIPIPGDQTLTVVVNPDHTLVEGGLGYANNVASIPIHIAPPTGTVYLTTPTAGTTFGPSDSFFVSGVVRDSNGNDIPNLNLTIEILNGDGSQAAAPVNTTTDATGVFQYTLVLNNLKDGTYTLKVSSSQGQITAATPSIVVKQNLPFLSQPVPLLGIPWWLFLIIIAAVAAIAIGVTVYFRVYGLGKMVECGECGAFIPEDATVCPKCGVEFEKDMAKCSNCQAWIPVDVKQCPECGVEFATGEVEMADYQEKMRLQYDEVVQKFKEDASRQLGRALSDREFQEWWRKQPTFLTFEDWLREEEEMRKMGSRPCPVCGTLNSVTATVCHKCGSLMKEEKKPPTGGTGGLAPATKQRAAVSAAPTPTPGGPAADSQGGAQAGAGPEAIPRRVIRRPVTPAPLVQKKVIKRPMGEGDQGSATEGAEDQGQSSDGSNNQGDEL